MGKRRAALFLLLISLSLSCTLTHEEESPVPVQGKEHTLNLTTSVDGKPLPTPLPTAPPLPTGTATPTSPSFSSMIAVARPSVVRINTSRGGGSGVIIRATPDGAVVLTNAHVVGQDPTVDVTVHDTTDYKGIVWGVDTTKDLALVIICCGGSFNALQFNTAEVGDPVALMGYALGIPGAATVTRGVVSALRHDAEGQRHLVQTDAAANSGNSGGPMLNMHGEIVGILTFGYQHAEGVSFAVSSQTAEPAVEVLKTLALTPTPTVPRVVYQRVMDFSIHRVVPDSQTFYVEFVNDSSTPLSPAEIDVRIADARDQPLTDWLEKRGSGWSGITLPGQTGYGGGVIYDADLPPTQGRKYQIRVNSSTTTAAPYPRLRIINKEYDPASHDYARVTVMVTNEGQRDTRNGGVLVVVRKSDGSLHEVGSYRFAQKVEWGGLGRELDVGESHQLVIPLVRGLPPDGGSYEVIGFSY